MKVLLLIDPVSEETLMLGFKDRGTILLTRGSELGERLAFMLIGETTQ